MNAKQTRREFLVNVSKITGAIIGILVFGKYATLSAHSSKDIHSGLKQASSGIGNKTLVAYTSKSGSTEEIAKFIGKVLSKNKTVDVLKISQAIDLSQ
jgi:hypothetical protein